MDYSPLIEKRRARLSELEALIAAPDFFNDQKRASELMREHRRVQELMQDWDQLLKCRRELEDNQELSKSDDEEMAEMARMEIEPLEQEISRLEEKVQYSLLPRDTTEDRDAIVEIRAGTGGDEASLFAGDLLGMYQHYSEAKGWKFELMEASPSDVGGFKEAVCRISGEEVFRFMKYESGVHRVQRVPATETQGRIHTSTATVAVLPEAEEVDIEIRPDDLRIETCRSGGAGGQHVNRTESAVQIFHLPTGLMVRCEEERSQMKNREKGMRILRAKLFEAKQREEHEKYSSQRRSLIGSGGREEKIRTYNFPQSRMTDHRVGYTSYNLDGILAGQINEVIAVLQHAEMQERLAEEGLA
ncbi:peptide chain release factor 1 [Akkermansia glycaniphila]|uniref:Peptide chain release factor 1 n=1 Tax=Akkermansia glycaniphila TaxID=1679444 RepID=A0A1C7PEU1_9BACT|nr:peptide chain release factor 1 [Akkermansia glycaniphila]OCA04090.1 peptide chain release factor 1 [Akkermansia glycaniphila]SEH69503.1 prfa: peptide chain release factor 1 [Akkermansia glycaniphila]